MLMRDEKEERKKQAWSNKQQGKATQAVTFPKKMSCMYMSLASYIIMFVCLGYGWVGYFTFLKLVCYAHVFP